MMIVYKCMSCENSIEKLISRPQDVRGVIPCSCGSWLERQLSAPSSNSTETIDTGGNIKPISFDRDRFSMAREQGDAMLSEKKKRTEEES